MSGYSRQTGIQSACKLGSASLLCLLSHCSLYMPSPAANITSLLQLPGTCLPPYCSPVKDFPPLKLCPSPLGYGTPLLGLTDTHSLVPALWPPLFSPPLAWPLEGHAQEFWNVPWTDTPKSTSCQHLTPGAPNPEGGLHSSSPVWCLSGLSPLRPRSSPQAEGVLKAQAPACLCCCQPCLHWS